MTGSQKCPCGCGLNLAFSVIVDRGMYAPAYSGKPQHTGTCECGAAKTGILPGEIGHSSWCPVTK